MSELLFANKSDLVAIADKIREKAGISDSLSFPQGFMDSIDGISVGGNLPTDALEGLEGGYDVMFYDGNKKGLAMYSIKAGHSINPPVYDCDGWQKADGALVTFPYTPTEDTILYILNQTLSDQLYDFYGIDKVVYPYILINYRLDGAKASQFGFAQTLTTSKFSDNSIRPMYSGVKSTSMIAFPKLSSPTIEEVVEIIMANVSKDSLTATGLSYQSSSSYKVFVNHSLAHTSYTGWVQFE